MGAEDFTITHRKTEVKDKVSSHHSTLKGNFMAWGTERSHGRELECVHKWDFYLMYYLHLSRLIIEPTRSPTVMVACSSSWCLRLTNHQSTRNKASARILMPAQMPTYLQNESVISACFLAISFVFVLSRILKLLYINLNFLSSVFSTLLLPYHKSVCMNIN